MNFIQLNNNIELEKMVLFIVVFVWLFEIGLFCQNMNGCIQCDQHAICTKCGPYHELVQNFCIYSPSSQSKPYFHSSTLNSLSNHGNLNFGVLKQGSTQNGDHRDHTEHIGMISQTLAFSGVGGLDFKQDRCGFRIKGICVFCNEGYKIQFNQCVPRYKRCIDFDERYLCRRCINELYLSLDSTCIDLNCRVGDLYDCKKCKSGFSKDDFGICRDTKCLKVKSGRCKQCIFGYSIGKEGLCVPTKKFHSKTINYVQKQENQRQKSLRLNEQNQNQGKTKHRIQAQTINFNQKNEFQQEMQQNHHLISKKISRVSGVHLSSQDFVDTEQNQKPSPSSETIEDDKIQPKTNQKITFPKTIQKIQIQPEIDNSKLENKNQNAKIVIASQEKEQSMNQRDSLRQFKEVKFCLEYNEKDLTCEECNHGLSLLNNYCIDNRCKYFSLAGFCRSCIEGYQLNNLGLCQVQDEECLQWSISTLFCTECPHTHYISYRGKCQQKPQGCGNVNRNGQCQTCKEDYYLREDRCEYHNITLYKRCVQREQSVCKKCQKNYFVNGYGNCTRSVSNCLSYNAHKCTKCENKYQLRHNKCIKNLVLKDPNCIIKNLKHECIICKTNFYSLNGFCEAVDPLCKGYNSTNGDCTDCYDGFIVRKGKCIENRPIPNCIYEQNNECIKCANRYYAYEFQCKEVPTFCDDYEHDTGRCLSCYKDHQLQNGKCVLKSETMEREQEIKKGVQQVEKPINKNEVHPRQISQYFCKVIDYENNKCLQCYNTFFLKNGQCQRINPLCRTHNQETGDCQSCYEGFTLRGDTCIVADDIATPTAYLQNCILMHENSCLKCADRYYLHHNQCLQVLPQCQRYNHETGQCTSCYEGYTLKKNRCALLLPSLSVPFCKEYNSEYECIECISGYHMNEYGGCSSVSLLCELYDKKNGHCLSCIEGYYLYEQKCIQPALGIDENCQEYDERGFCLKCKSNHLLEDFFCHSL